MGALPDGCHPLVAGSIPGADFFEIDPSGSYLPDHSVKELKGGPPRRAGGPRSQGALLHRYGEAISAQYRPGRRSTVARPSCHTAPEKGPLPDLALQDRDKERVQLPGTPAVAGAVA